MALATTSQTPDGYIHASFNGPLDIFSTSSSDVLAIGDSSTDPSELAALLKGPNNPTTETPDSPIRAAFEAGATPTLTTPTIMPFADPTAAPAIKDSAVIPVKPVVVDAQGRVDCSGSVSCKTDPVTKVTTVTYPDGVVAVVQQINDLTVVAYKTLTESLPAEIQGLLPPPPVLAPPQTSAAPAPARPTGTAAATPSSQLAAPTFDPGPQAPSSITPGPSDNSPKVNVIKPPVDFSSDSTSTQPSPNPVKPPTGLGKVKDAIGSVVNAVTGAIGKVVSPGAAGKPDATPSHGGRPTGSGTP